MKICIVAYKFGTEKEIGEHLGTYHWFIEFTRRLAKAEHEVFVVAPWLGFFKKGSTLIDGVKVLRYYPTFWYRTLIFPFNKIWRLFYLLATKNKVLKEVNKRKPEVILVWQARETGYVVAKIKSSLNAPFLFRQLGPWQWHLNRSAKEVYEKRSWYQILKKIKLTKLASKILEFLLDKKTQRKFAKAIYDKAEKVIFGSKISVEEGIQGGLNPAKAEIIPVTIETDLFRPLNQKQELRQTLGIRGSKILLFIGRLNFAEKGIGYLLEAVKMAKEKVDDLNLIIIGGGGEEERMLKMIKNLNLEKNVQPIGRKPFNDLVKYINASDVFMMTSVWLETFGQVTIEAMACGVPVISFNAGASPDININGQTGLGVPTKDSSAMAEAIVKIFKDDKLRQKMGQAARQRVVENYSYDVLINKFLKIVKNVRK